MCTEEDLRFGGIEKYLEVGKEERTAIINLIVIKLPEEERENAKQRVMQIVNNYSGVDANALNILVHAAERGELNEYAARLEIYSYDNLKYVHPENRSKKKEIGVFFSRCYNEMGVHSRVC